MSWKLGNPGCECCAPPCAITTFAITACCHAAVGAVVTIKTGGGTTVGTCTTGSGGTCTLDLSAYVGQTLYAFVSYQPTYFQPYSTVLLGNWCGRTYAYDLIPATYTSGAACGSLTITTTQCDGTTLYGGQAWTLQKWSGASWATYATGTTDATTAKSTVTGATYGGANDQYRWLVTDATGPITGQTITLTSANCVSSTTMRMATSTRLPCTSPNDSTTLSGGGATSYRQCCSTCDPVTVPGILTIVDPHGPDQSCGGGGGNFTCSGASYTGTLTGQNQGSQGLAPGCNSQWSLQAGTAYYGNCAQPVVANPEPGYPGYLAAYLMLCGSSTPAGSGLYLSASVYVLCDVGGGYSAGRLQSTSSGYPGLNLYSVVPGAAASGYVAVSSVTCDPFSATFSIPAISVPTYQITNGGYGYNTGTPYTFPARTITVHA